MSGGGSLDGTDTHAADDASGHEGGATSSEDDATGLDAPAESVESSTPGVPATTRNRVKSAALWGAVGGFTFLVLAQGYLLLGGELPFRYAGLFGLATVVAVVTTGITYLTEHRIRAQRSKRRT